MKLSSLSLAMLPLLSVFSAQAAVYSVTDLGTEAVQVRSTYGSALNDNGDTLVHGYGIYNFPLDLDNINFDSDAIKAILTEEQINDAKNGSIDATVLAILTNFLSSNSSVTTNQKIGQVVALTQTAVAPLALTKLRDTGNFSNSEYLYAINNQGVAVGTATTTFSLQEFTAAPTEATPDPQPADLWIPADMYQAGVVVNNGQASILQPSYTELGGGFSVAKAISNSGLIVGHGSASMPDSVHDAIEEACDGKAMPTALCFYNRSPNAYEQLGMVWQLQDSGSVSLTQTLGYLGDKNSGQPHSREDYAAVTYTSTANAVNDNGLIVGQSVYSDSDTIECVSVDPYYGYCNGNGVRNRRHATIFASNEVEAIVDPKEWLSSNATAVNNDNIVTGFASKTEAGRTFNKLFYYNYNTKQLVVPNGFFNTSNSEAAAINDQGQIVGKGEIFTATTSTRRLAAFLYDINADTFRNLNELVDCNLPYDLVEANAINNNGEILATAVVKREAKNAKGEPVIDSAGNPVFQEITTAVKLTPIPNGEESDCGAGEDDNYEREGGSVNWLLAMLGGLLLMARRRR